MLEIKPCLDLKEIARYCRKCGHMPGENYYLYIAENGGEIIAAGLFEVHGDTVRAVYYESAGSGACETDFDDYDEPFLFDGILRAGLNYASSQGIEKGIIPEAFRQKHMNSFSRLNYPPEPELNIINFFNKYKSCK